MVREINYKRKNKTISELLERCIDYALYMNEINLTDYEKDRLKEYSGKLYAKRTKK